MVSTAQDGAGTLAQSAEGAEPANQSADEDKTGSLQVTVIEDFTEFKAELSRTLTFEFTFLYTSGNTCHHIKVLPRNVECQEEIVYSSMP